MTYITLLLITLIVCYVIGVSGFIDSLKRGLWFIFARDEQRQPIPYPGNIHLKPIDCPLCMSFWGCIVGAIIMGEFSIYTIAFSALMAFLAPNIVYLMQVIQDALGWLISKIQTKL